MKRTFLSNEEIIDQWDAAISKNIALDRLAVACRTDRAGMKAKLRALGVTEDELEAVPTAKPKRAPDKPDARKDGRIDPARARELYDAGKNDVEIAAELGVKHATVCAWRKRNGLKANATSAFQRKKKEEKTMVEDNKTEAPKAGGFKLEPREAPTAVAMADAETMTLGGFKSVLHTLLGTQLDGGQLLIDGRVVHGVEGFEVTVRNNEICVDLRLAEAG